jgi:hypothetical protein
MKDFTEIKLRMDVANSQIEGIENEKNHLVKEECIINLGYVSKRI